MQRYRGGKQSDVFRLLKAAQFCWSLKCEKKRHGAEAWERQKLKEPIHLPVEEGERWRVFSGTSARFNLPLRGSA